MATLAKCTNVRPHAAHQLVDGMFTIECPGVTEWPEKPRNTPG